jgi:cap1 methyltransferase
LHVIDFWDSIETAEPFISAHVCEGPGGFLQNIVEEAKRRNIQLKKAYAITLKSTRAQIPGWKKSAKFLKKHDEIQLEYGADMTGDILNLYNQASFCSIASGANIFTADGGFDFSLDYAKQEESSFSLLLASFTMGLRCLRKGGTMIIKIFDMYSPVTRDLILGTASYFKKFMIYKPATSRPCNSERYFMAQGFEPNSDTYSWYRHLEYAQTKYREGPITRLVEGDWPVELEEAMQEQIQWQESMQIRSIDDAISMTKADIPEKVRNAIEISKDWCIHFNVPLVL